jgi:DNA-binding response OmpR family regulator
MTTILVVIEDPRRRDEVVSCLKRGRGNRVVGHGGDLTTALNALSKPQGIDILVVDIDRPEMVRKRTWAHMRMLLPGTRICCITEGEDSILEMAFASGIDSLHPHNVECSTLRRAIRLISAGFVDFDPALLEKAKLLLLEPARDSEIRLGGLVIDVESRKVKRWGECIQLSPLEFNVLARLAQEPGRVISTEELLRAVWGYAREEGGTPAQVKNCILRLRRKIEPTPSHPRYLLTVKGQGYLLRDPIWA